MPRRGVQRLLFLRADDRRREPGRTAVPVRVGQPPSPRPPTLPWTFAPESLHQATCRWARPGGATPSSNWLPTTANQVHLRSPRKPDRVCCVFFLTARSDEFLGVRKPDWRRASTVPGLSDLCAQRLFRELSGRATMHARTRARMNPV